MDTTNLQGGTQGKTMLLDFIQEVQVKSSGYNAEFGGSTGGVVSAITKSGSNNIRGSVGLYNQGTGGTGIAAAITASIRTPTTATPRTSRPRGSTATPAT